MTRYDQFLTVVGDLWDRAARGRRDPGAYAQLAASLRTDDIALLRDGLALALANGAAFDLLFELYHHRLLRQAEPAATLSRETKQRVIERGLGELTLTELVELSVNRGGVAELWDTLSAPGVRWAHEIQLTDVPESPSGPTPIGVALSNTWGGPASASPALPPEAGEAADPFRVSIRRTLRAALDLLDDPPSLDHRRTVDWLKKQLCGPVTLPAGDELWFFLRAGEELRDARRPRPKQAPPPLSVGGDGATVVTRDTALNVRTPLPAGSGPIPFGDMIQAVDHPFNPYVATATRELQASKPAYADVFLLRHYAARTEPEIAALVARAETQVRLELAVAEATIAATIDRLKEPDAPTDTDNQAPPPTPPEKGPPEAPKPSVARFLMNLSF